MRVSLAAAVRRWADVCVAPFGRPPEAVRAVYDRVLEQLNRTQSLEQILSLRSELCEVLGLASFDMFLLRGSSYVLQTAAGNGVALPASCAIVLRMKREYRAAAVAPGGSTDEPADGWQLLATPEELEVLRALRTELLVPLNGRSRLGGFAALAHRERRGFALHERRFLRVLGPVLGRALETALFVETLSDQAVERAHALRELALAREVQERLLPVALPALPGLKITAAWQCAEEVGGDYYDAFLTPGGQLCVLVADVSGKGISAALVMAALRATLHALMLQANVSIEAILPQCNTLLYEASSASRYATLFLGLYDPATEVLTFVNAGHNPPMLRSANGSIRRLTTGGPVLGLLPQTEFVAESVAFRAGDTLLAFTDGVTEAMNPKLEEWQESGLMRAWRGWEKASAVGLIPYLLERLKAFTRGAAQSDDITLLVLERDGADENGAHRD